MTRQNKRKFTLSIDLLELLGVIFIVLKLCNIIHWSWLWVLSPIWISVLYVIIFIVIYTLVYFFMKY